jgi:hypothetical protein
MSGQEELDYDLAGPTATPPTSWCYWVVEDRLLAGAYPGSPDPNERRSKIQSLLGAGVRTFINLMEEDETNYQGQPFAPYDDLAREMCPDGRCLRFAIRDLSLPSEELMVEILDEIDSSTADGAAAYIHCWGGVGRTGTVVACWLLRHHHADKDGVLEVLTRLREKDQDRGHRRSPETPEQAQFVRSWTQGR